MARNQSNNVHPAAYKMLCPLKWYSIPCNNQFAFYTWTISKGFRFIRRSRSWQVSGILRLAPSRINIYWFTNGRPALYTYRKRGSLSCPVESHSVHIISTLFHLCRRILLIFIQPRTFVRASSLWGLIPDPLKRLVCSGSKLNNVYYFWFALQTRFWWHSGTLLITFHRE